MRNKKSWYNPTKEENERTFKDYVKEYGESYNILTSWIVDGLREDEMVEKYKNDDGIFKNAFKKIANNMKEWEPLPEGVVTDKGAFENLLHGD